MRHIPFLNQASQEDRRRRWLLVLILVLLIPLLVALHTPADGPLVLCQARIWGLC